MSQVTLGQQYEITAGVGLQAEEEITFTGDAGNAGKNDGNPFVLFSVTGLVEATVYAICEVDLVGSATIKVGTKRSDVAGGGLDSTGLFIPSTTATKIDAYEVWYDANPQSTFVASNVTNFPKAVISRDIVLTVGSADITAGRIRFVCIWKPLTDDSSVTNRHIGSPSLSPSASRSPSASTSPSTSTSPSSSASASLSPSTSVSPSSSLSPSASGTRSPSSSRSASLSPSTSVSPSTSLSSSPSASTSPSSSRSPSASISSSPSASVSSSPSASVSPSTSVSISPSSSVSPSTSISASPSPSP